MYFFFFLMRQQQPRSKRPDTLFPYPTLFRPSGEAVGRAQRFQQIGGDRAVRRDGAGKRVQPGDIGADVVQLDLGVAPLGDQDGVAGRGADLEARVDVRSEEHTSELQSLMRISYAVFCLKKKSTNNKKT